MFIYRLLDDIVLIVLMFCGGFMFAQYIDKSYAFIANIIFTVAVIFKFVLFILQDRAEFLKKKQ